ncbi:MAG: TAXI family TRAP transporter solute-binding subunit [Alphaproteobacteria bacterium]|jgi:TRAP transporter TAXI family solute receptor|nr:TAXI family TRAP transporter solute-binding subunit [Alphaproteobacteria bacterium]MDP6517058.1 TAXI family TRAP transporter solute-binding subunit [Alphaproteobacteria bacterium]
MWLAVLAAAATLASAGAGHGQGLPKTFAWTAYGTTSSGYAVSVAIGNALAEEGYKLRVVPAKNDISRMIPLKAGRVQFSAMGIGSFLAQEGVLDFAAKRWGPQRVRVIMMSWANSNTGLPATARDSAIETAADLKGKRVAWVLGAPALNQNMTAWLAFGGTNWDEVDVVEVSGWRASIQGIIDGTIDAAIASTDSSMLFQLDGSPRGLRFFEAPTSDIEGWRRLLEFAPWYAPHRATAGVGLSPDNPLDGASYGYPILTSYAGQDPEMAYELAKLLHTKFDAYKDSHSNAIGWAMDRQVFAWIVPYADGAVRYFKEIGVWNEEHEANNHALIERQRVLAEAWARIEDAEEDDEAHQALWLAERKHALTGAGFDPVW